MKLLFMVLGLGLSLSINVSAKTLEDNLALCQDCHGESGISQSSDIPIIAGFSDIAIIDMMTAYRDLKRTAIMSKFRSGDTSRPETSMNEITENMSDEEIEALATHYSELPFIAAKQPFDGEKAAIGAKIHKTKCFRCHEDGGSSKDDDVGLLAGQWSEYLRTAINNFLEEKRETDPKMLKALKSLSDQEVDALLNYWASQQ